jgi:hypothetical protein
MNSDPPRQGDPSFADDALRRLEQRLDRASEAAERMIAEAAAGAAAGRREPKPPPAGWEVPREEQPREDGDLELLTQVLQSVRDLIPPELQRRLAEALRELLLALRALIDFYLERLERRRAAPADLEDIPIL